MAANTWTWDGSDPSGAISLDGKSSLRIENAVLGTRWMYFDGAPETLFTENETNNQRLYGAPDRTPFVKDAFERYLIHGEQHSVNPAGTGTKAAMNYRVSVPAYDEVVLKLRLTDTQRSQRPFAKKQFDDRFVERIREADEFYATLGQGDMSADARAVQRQAFAGMLWSKQFYHYVVRDWLSGDPAMPPPRHLVLRAAIAIDPPLQLRCYFHAGQVGVSWYAAWDLAFTVFRLLVDAEFAKEQLVLMLREWYMHPNGQIPAYEWAFGDVNPPVHAWAALRVYQIDKSAEAEPTGSFSSAFFTSSY